LIAQWRLAPYESRYIERQQGFHCVTCGSNVRSMALATAILRGHSFSGTLAEFVESEVASSLRVLEINRAGTLTQFLSRMPRHRLAEYPKVDMLALPFPDASFDIIVHSDTLEHIAEPIAALRECRRALQVGGACAFTVPIIIDRLTSSRAGLPPSYHGSEENRSADHLVHTEYGADAWRHVIQAGFAECRIIALEHPVAHALVGLK
jgi:SAM-dependent methyltransferase